LKNNFLGLEAAERRDVCSTNCPLDLEGAAHRDNNDFQSFYKYKIMANTYSQINLHLVFAVKNRQALIQNQWKERLHTYVTGIIHTNRHKVLQVNSHFDHIHILLNYQNLTQPIPELVEKIKTSSNKFVNDNQLSPFRFEWQKGYGVFSYSRSQVPQVATYIQNQATRHQKRSFRQEYLEMLTKSEGAFEERFLFEFWESERN
jgi:REP element-mobilizing transposase RayT